MEIKEGKTKQKILASFRQLFLQKDFESLTVKNITDHAGIGRPTFYNYFQDKYQLLEYIIETDLLQTFKHLFKVGLPKEALRYFFQFFEQEADFYRKAFKIQGQNSFKSMFINQLNLSFEEISQELALKVKDEMPVLTVDLISKYYARGLVDVTEAWLTTIEGQEITAEVIYDTYYYLVTHSIVDLIEMD